MIKNLAIGGGSNRTFLLLAVLLGALAAVLIGVYLSQAGDKSSSGGSAVTVPVAVASINIPASTRITQDMLVVKQISADAVLLGAFSSTDTVVGQVTQLPITAGEQILPSKVTSADVALANFGGNAPLSLIVPQGKRAFAISLSPVGAVGGLLRAGDFIDIILSGGAGTNVDGKAALAPGAACFVAQNIEVLAVGTTIKNNSGAGNVDSVASNGTDNAAQSATLAVSPDQTWWLAAAQQSVNQQGVGNQLWVSLRSFGDRDVNAALPACAI